MKTISGFVENLERILLKQDIEAFRKTINKLRDCNDYIVYDTIGENRLNTLHFLACYPENCFSLRCIEMILSHQDIDINATGMMNGNFNLTPAHMAIIKNNVKVLQLLVDKNCDLLICESFGKNIQDYAKREKDKYPEIYKIVQDGIHKWYDRRLDKKNNDNNSEEIHRDETLVFHPRVRFTSESSTISESNSSDKDTLKAQMCYKINANSVRKFWNIKDEEQKQKIAQKSDNLIKSSFKFTSPPSQTCSVKVTSPNNFASSVKLPLSKSFTSTITPVSPRSDVFFTPLVSNSTSIFATPTSAIPPPPPLPQSNVLAPSNYDLTPKRSIPSQRRLFSRNDSNNNFSKISSSINIGSPLESNKSRWSFQNVLLENDKWTSSESYFSLGQRNLVFTTPKLDDISVENKGYLPDCQITPGTVQKVRRYLFNE